MHKHATLRIHVIIIHRVFKTRGAEVCKKVYKYRYVNRVQCVYVYYKSEEESKEQVRKLCVYIYEKGGEEATLRTITVGNENGSCYCKCIAHYTVCTYI